jgi:uncharacterized integral membrane protein
MGERTFFQPLTKEDKITVILYRAGILLSTLTVCVSAILALASAFGEGLQGLPLIASGLGSGILVLLLYFSVGLSVFFIHLYVGKFYRILKKIYYAAALCLVVMFLIGNGNPAAPLFAPRPMAGLLLLPLSLCLGFVTAKEAFCFRLLEGYILAVAMPAYIFFYSLGALDQRGSTAGLSLIAMLLLLFMLRKIFMPIAYDIGDKSAYQP